MVLTKTTDPECAEQTELILIGGPRSGSQKLLLVPEGPRSSCWSQEVPEEAPTPSHGLKKTTQGRSRSLTECAGASCCQLLRSCAAKVAEGAGSEVKAAACSHPREVASPIAAPFGEGSRANSEQVLLAWCSSGAPMAASFSTKVVRFAGITAACSDPSHVAPPKASPMGRGSRADSRRISWRRAACARQAICSMLC